MPMSLPDDDDVLEAHVFVSWPLEVRVQDVAETQHPPLVVQYRVPTHIAQCVPAKQEGVHQLTKHHDIPTRSGH